MTRNEAFARLIHQRNWYASIGISPKTAATHKKRYLEGKVVSYEFITRALKAAGYSIEQEEIWTYNK